jgi:hypothetical protein
MLRGVVGAMAMSGLLLDGVRRRRWTGRLDELRARPRDRAP